MMNMKKRLIILFAAVIVGMAVQARERVNFDKGWKFILADKPEMAQADFDDSEWRTLDVPHDWAIEGDFYVGNPSGAGGGALPGGIGWYRKMLEISHFSPLTSRYYLEFDGVYMNSTVFVNGQKVGFRPYGYSSFEYDITEYLKEGRNIVAVKVDNSDQPNSRWYSGCGIYRHVWLTKTNPVHVKHWGVFADARVVKGKGKVNIEVAIDNVTKYPDPGVTNTLIAPNGKVVGKSKGVKSSISISKPVLWSCETPNIYKILTEVTVGGKVVDTYETTTGFRDFKFDAKTGFWLNGKNFKLNGVCEHHDFGCLGAALNEDALHRKLTKLKAMGVNSIRSSHNPPTPELLNMCDTMGLIVMDESFDMYQFIRAMNLVRPAFYGFSDGGIIGLLLIASHPDSIGALAISGTNLSPEGLTSSFIEEYTAINEANPDPLLTLMLTEPHIDPEGLKKITVPVLVTAGENDLILQAETEKIADLIPDSTLVILEGEDHGSYIVNSEIMGGLLIDFLNREWLE